MNKNLTRLFMKCVDCDCIGLLNLHLHDKVRDDLPTYFSLEWMWGKRNLL